MTEEMTARGIILSSAIQGESARRLSILTDRLGRISAFASGGSRLIGKLRPFTAGTFTLARGRGAYRIRTVEVMEAFEEVSLDPDTYIYGSYVLETAGYYSREGMDEREALALLNLIYLTLDAMRHTCPEGLPLIRAVYELRLLRIEGEYSERPDSEEAGRLWSYVLRTPLKTLFDLVADPPFSQEEREAFTESATRLFGREAGHSFRALGILRQTEK